MLRSARAQLAYAARLYGLVTELGVTVVIVDPPLNLSLFDRQAPERFTSVAPGVETWLVGGHSMGGVRACELAEEAGALKLFASYCAADISTPEKIAEHRDALPGSAEMVEIAGASHASFGDHWPQSGDGTATIDDAEMDAAVEDAVAELLRSMP
ncbi:alpha/beta hydrolase [Brachybacterium paraconglomeratum]|uniref:alpha/beta hydrolase n=1 Tax=Brachybacterium paraconglomeratum TaxID=173362 RepID=UPI002882EE41|nr:alpha/beta hydrolase [Brachybacterium paraconglomeratum]